MDLSQLRVFNIVFLMVPFSSLQRQWWVRVSSPPADGGVFWCKLQAQARLCGYLDHQTACLSACLSANRFRGSTESETALKG